MDDPNRSPDALPDGGELVEDGIPHAPMRLVTRDGESDLPAPGLTRSTRRDR